MTGAGPCSPGRASQNAYIIEDDYLGELQLHGRAAPALASIDRNGRVLHIGTFSKTISPALRLGFMVVPTHLAHGIRGDRGLPCSRPEHRDPADGR